MIYHVRQKIVLYARGARRQRNITQCYLISNDLRANYEQIFSRIGQALAVPLRNFFVDLGKLRQFFWANSHLTKPAWAISLSPKS